MICTHAFHRIGDASRGAYADPASTTASVPIRPTPGVEVACVRCGQVRKAFADGTVVVTHQGGRPIDDHADDPAP